MDRSGLEYAIVNQFSLTYELVGTGWARATLTVDGADTIVTASYISDALRDLIDATSVMTEGGPTARCAWQEEPGEYRWIFTVEQTGVRLEIRSFPDMFDTAEDASGEIVFTTTQPLRTISRSILRAVDAVAGKFTPEAYLERWVEHPFPTEAANRLRNAYQRLT